MNIISNNCLGGHLYQQLNEPFSNPFIWTAIAPEDMVVLINQFNTIDFGKFSIELCKRGQPCIVLGNQIHIKYIHYIPSNAVSTLTRSGHDMLAPFQLLYTHTIDTYRRRLNRMITKKEAPMFILHLNNEKWDKLLHNITTSYPLILVAPVKTNTITNYMNEHHNVELCIPTKWDLNPGNVAEQTYKQLKERGLL